MLLDFILVKSLGSEVITVGMNLLPRQKIRIYTANQGLGMFANMTTSTILLC